MDLAAAAEGYGTNAAAQTSLATKLEDEKAEAARAGARNREAAAMMAAFTMDIGWVGIWPTLGLPAMVAALALQASVVVDSVRGTDRFDTAHGVTVLLWMVGNAFWMCSEYLWDEDRPEGVLAQVPSLAALGEDRAMFPDLLLLGAVIALIGAFSLVAFYGMQLWIVKPSWKNERYLGACFRGGDLPFGVPLHIYQQLFVLPWLLSDSLWVLCNRRDALGLESGLLVPVSVALGVTALALLVDCVRRHLSALRPREAAQCFAELLWVAGNVAWFVADMRGEETLAARNFFCGMFAAGLCLVCYLTATEVSENPDQRGGIKRIAGEGVVGEKLWLLQGVPAVDNPVVDGYF